MAHSMATRTVMIGDFNRRIINNGLGAHNLW